MRDIISALATAPNGLSTSGLARRAGLDRSTVHRVAAGASMPSLDTLRELAIAHGLDLVVSTVPLSDPDAAAAARVLLDPEGAAIAETPGITGWLARLRRTVPGTDTVDVLAVAGRAASLLHRPGVGLLRGDRSARRLASAGDAAGGEWAISGAAALDLAREEAVAGPSVLWTTDVRRTMRMFTDTHRGVSVAGNAQVIVARVDDVTLVDAHRRGPIRYVAPIQFVLDSIGLGGALERSALDLAESWR